MADISATQWQQLNPLLDELLEAQAEARTQRLDQIRRNDAALADCLETLLRQRTAVERDAFLEGDAGFTLAHEPSLAGQTIGAYTLSEPIGRGGMGSVWRAERSDGRYQAIVALNEAARPHVAEGLGLMDALARPFSAAQFECYRADAMLASATGEHARGVARMERWLGQLERDGLGKTRAYLNSLASLAYIHYRAGELVPALAVARRARALNEALGSEATLSSQTELDLEADLLFQLGRFSEATEVDREMLRRFADTGATPPPHFMLKPAWHAIMGGQHRGRRGVDAKRIAEI